MEEKESLWERITKPFTKYNRKEIENIIKSRDEYREMYVNNIIQLSELCNNSRYIAGMAKDLHDIKFHIFNGQSDSFGFSGSSGFSFSVGLMILKNNLQTIEEYLTTMLKSDGTVIVRDYSPAENTTNLINLINSLLKNNIIEYTEIPDSNLAKIKVTHKK
jgi:hypothetical protein